MPLVRVEVTPTAGRLPPQIAKFVRAADRRTGDFHEHRTRRPLHAFVSSDLEGTWRMIDAIVRGKLAPGRNFCEWGCGFAAVAGLAALSGFDACGIEIERDLVDEANRLMTDFSLKVPIAQGNFVPQDAGELADCSSEFTYLSERGPDGHAVLRRDPDDFDLVFAYPWPGSEDVIFRLFDTFAATDALLLTFHGSEGLLVDRKVATREWRRR
jgi:hypothetical protein